MPTEDELYEAWSGADRDTRLEIEARLFHELIVHAGKVAALRGHIDDDFAKSAASEVMSCLRDFDGLSKFSTWSHRIILNKLCDCIEERVTERQDFIDLESIEELPLEKYPSELRASPEEELIPGLDIELARPLFSEDELRIIELGNEELNQREIAERMNLPLDNIEAKIESMRKKWRKFQLSKRKTGVSRD